MYMLNIALSKIITIIRNLSLFPFRTDYYFPQLTKYRVNKLEDRYRNFYQLRSRTFTSVNTIEQAVYTGS